MKASAGSFASQRGAPWGKLWPAILLAVALAACSQVKYPPDSRAPAQSAPPPPAPVTAAAPQSQAWPSPTSDSLRAGGPATTQAAADMQAGTEATGGQVPASVVTQAARARQAFGNMPVRAGDVIEVRYYRNTALEAGRYAILVGDVLRVDVVEHDDLSRDSVLVLPDGYITLPLIGSLPAAGDTVDQLSKQITNKFVGASILDPQVTVAVVQSDRRLEGILDRGTSGVPQPSVRFTVSESGMLNLPYIEPINVGGHSMASLQQLVRSSYRNEFRGQLEVTANLVERAVPLVYVMGEVVNPVGVEVAGRLNPLMAVAAAGGFLPTAAPDEVRVVRIRPDGTYDQWAFNLEGGLEGGRVVGADFQLLPQDVVIVPPSGIAKAGRWVDQWIRQLLPFSLNAGFGLSYEIGGDDND